jgi:uncharacterized protein VirK/YbjX
MGELPRAVVGQDQLPIQPGTLLRDKVRGISRKCARHVKDLLLHVPGFIAFGAGPVPRVVIRHRYKLLIDLALHLPGLVGLSVQIRRAGFGCATRSEPLVLFKYLGDYLANSFSTAARLRIMSHHYRTLVARLPELSKLGCPRHELVLWSHRVENDTFTILLRKTNHYFALEGDLSLDFLLNEICLHRLSFTCIPGKEVGLEGETALLVGGSQGGRGTAALIRHASKAIGEISPAVMLVLGLQALSKRLGADAILGITAAERPFPDEAKAAQYDAFWEALGGERHGRFYRLPTGVAWKDSSHLSNAHRARALRKRGLKERLLAQMREKAERFLLAAAAVVADNESVLAGCDLVILAV